jgi:hypothetical protein
MKNLIRLSLLLLISAAAVVSLRAGETAEEKAFIEKYKKAFEANDTPTLESFLYTPGANSTALEFYKMMQAEAAGGKISKIDLVDLTPEEAAKAAALQEGPGGQKLQLTLKPTKKLVVSVEKKDANGSSTSTTTNFVAEKNGKIVIPVPGDAKP